MTTLELSHVFKRVNAPVERTILSDISLRIAQGDFACIRGKSGAGKSTLLNILGLLDTGFEGEYLLDGVPVSDLSVREFGEARAHIFGFIFQSFHLFPDRSVLDNVLLGNLYVTDSSAQRRERALDALAFVGLEERADQLVSTLSGGEQQRIAIARTVAADHDIIIADEPTGNLDSHSAALVLSLLQDLNRAGKTIVLVTHDDEVASLARTTITLSDGHVVDAPSVCSPPHLQSAEDSCAQCSQVAGYRRLWRTMCDAYIGTSARARRRAFACCTCIAVAISTFLTCYLITASFQVTDAFNTQANRRVILYSPQGTQIDVSPYIDDTALARIREVAGVENVNVLSTRGQVTVSAAPPSPGSDTSTHALVVGATLDSECASIMMFHPAPACHLEPGHVLVGARLAETLNLGPASLHPTVWVEGRKYAVAAIIDDAQGISSLVDSLVMSETDAASFPATYVSAILRVRPGAATQVAHQAPFAWTPASHGSIQVDAPPEPRSLRGSVEGVVRNALTTTSIVVDALTVVLVCGLALLQVRKRRWEIGVRRAIGARSSDIALLLIGEILPSSLVGGIVGVCVGLMTLNIVTLMREWIPVFDLRTIGLYLTGSAVVGLVGALYPTIVACRIDPIDALRSSE